MLLNTGSRISVAHSSEHFKEFDESGTELQKDYAHVRLRVWKPRDRDRKRKKLVMYRAAGPVCWSGQKQSQKLMDSDLIIRLIESQLKTSYCPKFDHKFTFVFEKSESEELPDDTHKNWPPDRKHRHARETHHLLNARFPVSDDNVNVKSSFTEIEGYKPNWATLGTVDGDHSRSTETNTTKEKNPQGRFESCAYFPVSGLILNNFFSALDSKVKAC